MRLPLSRHRLAAKPQFCIAWVCRANVRKSSPFIAKSTTQHQFKRQPCAWQNLPTSSTGLSWFVTLGFPLWKPFGFGSSGIMHHLIFTPESSTETTPQQRESLSTGAQKPLPLFQSIANLGCACLQDWGHQQRLMTSRFQEMFFKALRE